MSLNFCRLCAVSHVAALKHVPRENELSDSLSLEITKCKTQTMRKEKHKLLHFSSLTPLAPRTVLKAPDEFSQINFRRVAVVNRMNHRNRVSSVTFYSFIKGTK